MDENEDFQNHCTDHHSSIHSNISYDNLDNIADHTDNKMLDLLGQNQDNIAFAQEVGEQTNSKIKKDIAESKEHLKE